AASDCGQPHRFRVERNQKGGVVSWCRALNGVGTSYRRHLFKLLQRFNPSPFQDAPSAVGRLVVMGQMRCFI
ncbi:unnamed protein product, partial [Prunus brigantina]